MHNHQIIFLEKKMRAWYDIKVVAKQRLTFENWTKKTNQMCRDFIQLNEETTISYLLKRYNKSVIKMSFQSLWKFKFSWEFDPGPGRTLAACLIHASRTRATGACTGQSSGERVSNTWVTCPSEGDNIRKRMLKPHRSSNRMVWRGKEAQASADGWTRGALASWWGNGSPRPWCIADLRGWSATLGLRHGPNSYGRQQ